MGEIIFRVTIVETKEVFWTDQDTDVFRIRNGRVVENQKFLSNGEEVTNDVNVDNNAREDGQSVQANGQRATTNVILNYSVCDRKFCLGLGQTDNCVATKSCELLLAGNSYLVTLKLLASKIIGRKTCQLNSLICLRFK